MTTDAKLRELGTFLKTRRGELPPRRVGLAEIGTRRVTGLRREEVAQLAAISTDYYIRIEQGRIHASAPVLTTLAEVLHLDQDQRAYLFSLAGTPATRAPRLSRQNVRPELQRLLVDLNAVPAVVLGRRMDVLGWNRLAAAMITDFGEVPERHRNYIRILFTDPVIRSLYADWEAVAKTAVAQLRMAGAKTPDDPRLAALVGELSVSDPQFSQWWAARNVAALVTGVKVLHHPVVGELVLDWETLITTADPDQQLLIWTAPADSPTYDALRLLASWAASPSGSPPAGPPSRAASKTTPHAVTAGPTNPC